MIFVDRTLKDTAAQLAVDRVLNDPTDNEIVCAVLDYLAPNKPVALESGQREAILAAYDEHDDQ